MEHPTPQPVVITNRFEDLSRSGPLRLAEAVHLYKRQRESEGYSPNTLQAYGLHYTQLLRETGNVPLDSISLDLLRAHVAGYAHLKPTSRAQKIRALRALWRWAVDEGHTGSNPTVNLKAPKLPIRIPKHLSTAELELLRDSCETVFEHALLELLFATAARIAEVQGMNRADVDMQHKSIIVMGKGSKEREVYLGAKALIWLQRYLETRSDDDPALFATTKRPHRRMSVNQLRAHVNKVSSRCGLRDRVTPHVLRHTLATHLLDQGMSLAALQSYLGHTKPETTLVYANLSGAARRREFEKHFFQ